MTNDRIVLCTYFTTYLNDPYKDMKIIQIIVLFEQKQITFQKVEFHKNNLNDTSTVLNG